MTPGDLEADEPSCPACGAAIPAGTSRCPSCGKGRPAFPSTLDSGLVPPADLEWGPHPAKGIKATEDPRKPWAILAGSVTGLVLGLACVGKIAGVPFPQAWVLALSFIAILQVLVATTIARLILLRSNPGQGAIPPRGRLLDVVTTANIFLQSILLTMVALPVVVLAMGIAFVVICIFGPSK